MALDPAGRTDPAPNPPVAYRLGDAGREWWAWAWALPQATMWDAGALYFAARRAQLEDELAVLGAVDGLSVAEVLGVGDEREFREQLEWLIGGLKRMAGGSTGLKREMRELDNRLGLNPKAMADLRWTIAAATEQASTAGSTAADAQTQRRTSTGQVLEALA